LVGEAVNVTEVPEHILLPGFAAILTAGIKTGFTVIVILLLETVVGAAQVAFDVRDKDTTSPFASVVEVKVLLFVPALVPFTVHWYEGDAPPFKGLAVNVTDVPAQMLVLVALMLTLGTTTLFTAIVIVLLVAVDGDAQVAFDVNITLTLSLFPRVAEVKVLLFVPAFTPFTCHW